jgi:hypothetical protein
MPPFHLHRFYLFDTLNSIAGFPSFWFEIICPHKLPTCPRESGNVFEEEEEWPICELKHELVRIVVEKANFVTF